MIHITIDGVPISANNAYANIRGGGRMLSSAGKKYIAETKSFIAQKCAREMTFFKKNRPYLVFIRFYFSTIENSGWFKGKAENRYKRIDVSNRVKLLEDCLKDVAGIDDSQHLRLVLDKVQAADGKEKTDIWIWDMDEEGTPFDEGFNVTL